MTKKFPHIFHKLWKMVQFLLFGGIFGLSYKHAGPPLGFASTGRE
jgi:hypothetical protein